MRRWEYTGASGDHNVTCVEETKTFICHCSLGRAFFCLQWEGLWQRKVSWNLFSLSGAMSLRWKQERKKRCVSIAMVTKWTKNRSMYFLTEGGSGENRIDILTLKRGWALLRFCFGSRFRFCGMIVIRLYTYSGSFTPDPKQELLHGLILNTVLIHHL